MPAMALTSVTSFPYGFPRLRCDLSAPGKGLESVLTTASEADLKLIRLASMLESNPAGAAAGAAQIVRTHPGHAAALLLLATAHRACGDAQTAVAEFAALAAAQPDSPVVCLELGRALLAAGRDSEALAAFQRTVELAPDL